MLDDARQLIWEDARRKGSSARQADRAAGYGTHGGRDVPFRSVGVRLVAGSPVKLTDGSRGHLVSWTLESVRVLLDGAEAEVEWNDVERVYRVTPCPAGGG